MWARKMIYRVGVEVEHGFASGSDVHAVRRNLIRILSTFASPQHFTTAAMEPSEMFNFAPMRYSEACEA